jgi:hypothetical protein
VGQEASDCSIGIGKKQVEAVISYELSAFGRQLSESSFYYLLFIVYCLLLTVSCLLFTVVRWRSQQA